MDSSTSQGPWLVKSGDRVLGPFSTSDLSNMIREREVVIIDEVMAPEGRWAYVRDVLTFQNIVEEIRRGLMTQQENTEIQGYTNQTNASTQADFNESEHTPTPTETQDLTIVTKTETVSNGPAIHSPIKRPPDFPLKVSTATPVSAPSSQPARSVMTPLSHHTPEAPREGGPASTYEGPRLRARTASLIGAMILIVAVVFVLYSVMKNQRGGGSSFASGDSTTQASVAWKRGEFDRALDLYRNLNRSNPADAQIASRLAILMMKLDGQTVEAKRVIENAKPEDDESKADLAIAMGLATLASDDPREAAVQFAKAGPSWIAWFDRGVAFGALKNWSESLRAFAGAGENPAALLMLARTHLNSIEGGVSKVTARQSADVAITKSLARSPDFHQEALVVGAYIDAISSNTKRASARVFEAIETDPSQTADHFHDPGLSLDSVAWSKLLPYCQAIHNELNSHFSGGLMAICLAKSNQLQDASKMVEQELGKESANPQLLAIQSYLHGLADRDGAARASLMMSTKAGPSRLAQILNARLCMREKQDTCAEEAWSKLASEPNPPIASMVGLAAIRKAKGDTNTSNALLVKAESMSPTYLPLLRLREDASR